MIIKRTLFQQIGGNDGGLTSCKDWDFWIRASAAGVTFATYPGRLDYNTETEGISRNLYRVWEGRNQLWAKHPDLFSRLGRPADLYRLLRYAIGNCATGGQAPDRARGRIGFALFRTAHSAGRRLYELLARRRGR